VSEPSTHRPFVFTVIEDDGVNVTIEVSEEDYQADLAAGIDEEDTMKPRRYKWKDEWLTCRRCRTSLLMTMCLSSFNSPQEF
jgi:hypothetical protein